VAYSAAPERLVVTARAAGGLSAKVACLSDYPRNCDGGFPQVEGLKGSEAADLLSEEIAKLAVNW